MISFGEMIRDAEPNALILGPEEIGWYSFYFSGLDLKAYNDNGTTPDYTSHGNTFYMDWLLDQLFQHDQANPNKRVLDVFSFHWYPSGYEFSNDTSQATELLRNRSTRALWDPNYADENGVVDPLTGLAAKPDFIHRMQNEVNTYYPGLKTAITEYSWGAVDDMNGATAQADVLGILGRERIDIATAWFDQGMDQTQPAAKAFAMYRNYDGNNSTFGDTNVRATVANPDNVASFAAERASDGAFTIVVINKYLTQTADVTVTLSNFQNTGTAQVWQLANNTISHPADEAIAASSFGTSLPAKSITIFVVSLSAPSGDPAITWNGKSELQWAAITNSSWYNVYRGVPGDLPNLLNGADDSCRKWTGTTLSTGSVLTDTPAAGSFWWYIVRSANPGGEGPAGNATAGPRILNSTGPCP